jgi:hypothetical protein
VTHPIAISPSITQYFHEIIDDALRSRQIQATDAAASYLVGLLASYVHPDEEAGSTFSEPLTFLLRDAMQAIGPERFRRLRALGDGVLYALGFFSEHIEVRGVDRGYVVTVGSTAYDHAAAMLRPARSTGPDVLSELAVKFDRFASVLSDVAESTLARNARGDQGVVKLYERWLRTGSSRIAGELGARGIIPTRSGGGMN